MAPFFRSVRNVAMYYLDAYAGDRPFSADYRGIMHSTRRTSREDCIVTIFTRDGRLTSFQYISNPHYGFAIREKKEYLFAFKWCKMCVMVKGLSYFGFSLDGRCHLC